MPPEHEQGEHPLVVKMAAGALGAAVGLAGPDAAVAGAAVAPVIEDILGQILSKLAARRVERVAETLTDAAAGLGGDAAEQLRRLVGAAASDEAYQELLARTLTIAQDTAMRDKRRALGRALANALADVGTKVDEEIAFVRMLADLDPVHIRVLNIMSRGPEDDPISAHLWGESSVVQADPGLKDSVLGALTVLNRHGLIEDHGEHEAEDYPEGVPPPFRRMEREYAITGYGDYLIRRLAEPD